MAPRWRRGCRSHRTPRTRPHCSRRRRTSEQSRQTRASPMRPSKSPRLQTSLPWETVSFPAELTPAYPPARSSRSSPGRSRTDLGSQRPSVPERGRPGFHPMPAPSKPCCRLIRLRNGERSRTCTGEPLTEYSPQREADAGHSSARARRAPDVRRRADVDILARRGIGLEERISCRTRGRRNRPGFEGFVDAAAEKSMLLLCVRKSSCVCAAPCQSIASRSAHIGSNRGYLISRGLLNRLAAWLWGLVPVAPGASRPTGCFHSDS